MTMLVQWEQSFHEAKRLCVVPTKSTVSMVVDGNIYMCMTCGPCGDVGMAVTLVRALTLALALMLIPSGSSNNPVVLQKLLTWPRMTAYGPDDIEVNGRSGQAVNPPPRARRRRP